MQTCTHHGQDPALKAASQALAGTSEWFWNEHGDQHVESGCASVTDAHNGATPTWEHALQLTLRETSSCSPAVDQQDDVSGTACASLQACAASKPAPRLALCNVSKDIKLEVKAPAADTAGCRSPQATVPDRTEADAHEPPEKVTAHQPWADQEMGQHDFAINPISNAEDIGQPAEDRMGVHAGFLNGTTGYNPALEGSASPLAYQSRNEAFLEGWGDTSGYSPLAVKGSFTSHQHSSLWARSPLFEANHSSARGSPGKPAFLGSLNTAAVPAASPWRSNPACNDAEAQLPAAPSVPQATSSWRGNANFDPAQAADPAFLPFHPKAWAQNRTFEPLAVPPLAPPDAAGRLSHDPWMSNGIFEPGIARGKEGSRIPGQPFMQQLGANQSTGPSGGTAGSSLQGSPHPEPPTDPETILDSRTEIMTAAPPESRSLYSTLVTDIDRDAYTSAGSEADSESSLALRRYLRPAAGAPRPSQLDTPVSSVHLSDSSGDESSPWGAARSGASSVPTFGVSGSPTRSPDRFRHPWAHPTPGSSVASSSAMMSPTLVGPGVVSPTNSSMASAGRGQHHSQESPSQGIGRGGQQRSRDRLGRRTGDLAASPASYEDRSGQEHESPGSDSMRTLPVCDLPDAQGLAPGACPQDGVRQSMTGSNVVGFDSSKADLDVVSTASPIEAMQVDDMQKPSPLHAALAPQASNLEQMQGASGLAVPMQMTVSHERDAQRDESPSTDWECDRPTSTKPLPQSIRM
ncbi:hypothetical protein WJX84_002254 [Apatococcus fuscideae]|uniref:Proteophosphoglycan ppg4 n=1 Tax=Apatococcus fuscideae TaxID=2026836 RepID=A0AAW1SMP2_9CHLO